VLEEAEGRVIERVFAMADRRAGSFVIPRRDVVCLEAGADREEIARIARASRDTHVPVSVGGLDGLLGVVSLVELAHGSDRSLRELVRPALFIPEQANALRAIESFREANAQIAFVADERGTIEGMLRLTDLLEEILGRAGGPRADDPGLTRRADGSLLIDGLLPLAEFLEEVGGEPGGGPGAGPGGGFDPAVSHTVGGLVVHHLGRVPEVGDSVVVGGWRFEVVDMDGRRVDKLLASSVG
jgi:putative hemolysin